MSDGYTLSDIQRIREEIACRYPDAVRQPNP